MLNFFSSQLLLQSPLIDDDLPFYEVKSSAAYSEAPSFYVLAAEK